jgi:hypothetical protein
VLDTKVTAETNAKPHFPVPGTWGFFTLAGSMSGQDLSEQSSYPNLGFDGLRLTW